VSSLETYIRQLADQDNVRIHLWQTKGGLFQANVSENAIGGAWTCHTAPDPIEALSVALRLRATGASGREVIIEGMPGYRTATDAARPMPAAVVTEATTDPRQVDIEEAIAAAPPPADDFEDFL